MNKHNPEPVLPEPANKVLQTKRTRELVPLQKETLCRRRGRTLRVDTGTMGTLEANRPSPKRALIARERSERNHARLCSWEKDTSRIQTQQAASDAENNPSTPMSDEAARRRRLLVCRSANDAAANGMNLVQHGAVGPQTRLNYATSLLKFASWLEPRNRCRNVHLDGKRVHARKSDELRGTVAQCLDGQVPIVRQAWCP